METIDLSKTSSKVKRIEFQPEQTAAVAAIEGGCMVPGGGTAPVGSTYCLSGTAFVCQADGSWYNTGRSC